MHLLTFHHATLCRRMPDNNVRFIQFFRHMCQQNIIQDDSSACGTWTVNFGQSGAVFIIHAVGIHFFDWQCHPSIASNIQQHGGQNRNPDDASHPQNEINLPSRDCFQMSKHVRMVLGVARHSEQPNQMNHSCVATTAACYQQQPGC